MISRGRRARSMMGRKRCNFGQSLAIPVVPLPTTAAAILLCSPLAPNTLPAGDARHRGVTARGLPTTRLRGSYWVNLPSSRIIPARSVSRAIGCGPRRFVERHSLRARTQIEHHRTTSHPPFAFSSVCEVERRAGPIFFTAH